MTDVLIVGTIHEEGRNSQISSSTLLDLATRYGPDVVMCECAIDELELYREKLFDPRSDSLEACFFAKYRALSGREPIPIDMAGKSRKFYNHDYWEQESAVWSRLEEIAVSHPVLTEHRRILGFTEEVGNHCSFNLLNSEFFDSLVFQAHHLMDELIPGVIREELPEWKGFWRESVALRQRRDREMFSNMVSRSAGHSKILVVVGAGHAPVLRRLLSPLVEANEYTESSVGDVC